MKRFTIITAVLFMTCGFSYAQDSAPPEITDVEWVIERYVGGSSFLDWYDPAEAFDPSIDLAHEGDLITLTITVTDADFDGEEGDALFYLVQSQWMELTGYPSPQPPPIVEDLDDFFPEDEGLQPASGTTLVFTHSFEVPRFTGVNQARLRGYITYDVLWYVRILVSNTQSPSCTTYLGTGLDLPCDEFVERWTQFLFAIENPVLGGPNPPPFADAGADQEVEAGDVTLDGSRSIDLYNLGFNTDSSNVIDKDTLTFTWEWISGPQRIDPEQTDDHEPKVTINLVMPGTYVYRLTVDDNINAIPSTDTVQIVVKVLEENREPKAGIAADPAGKTSWTVGETVTLVSTSTDPDGDTLEYRWRQTDELGGEIPSDSLRQVFQPISGMEDEEAKWQALLAGTYYFRLLASDGEFTDTDTFKVEVIGTSAAGTTAGGDEPNSSLLSPLGAAPGICGMGVVPFAAIPLAFCAFRRRAK